MTSEGTVLVTGAGRGIGESLAYRFEDEGYAVVVNDINEDAAYETAESLDALYAVPADISDPRECRRLVDEAVDEYGEIDVLVNNAGIQTTTPFLEMTEQEWDDVIATNLKGTYFLSQEVANHMVDNGIEGDIIHISSVHQETPRRKRNHYDASKAGIRMLTRDMSLELSDYGINVNCIAPGFIRTPMNEDVLESEEEMEMWRDKIPLGRTADPSEVAEAAVFLASDRSDYVTGSSLTVDGGLRHSTMEDLF